MAMAFAMFLKLKQPYSVQKMSSYAVSSLSQKYYNYQVSVNRFNPQIMAPLRANFFFGRGFDLENFLTAILHL